MSYVTKARRIDFVQCFMENTYTRKETPLLVVIFIVVVVIVAVVATATFIQKNLAVAQAFGYMAAWLTLVHSFVRSFVDSYSYAFSVAHPKVVYICA